LFASASLRAKGERAPELEREAGDARQLARAPGGGEVMPNKLEFAPDYWRKRAAETRGLAELIEDHFTAETLLEIAQRYDELALRAEQRPDRSN
jgi:hypothetical protein